MKQLAVLEKVAAALDRANIPWCLGASGLLYFKGKTDHFHDIDILVLEDDVPRLKEVLPELGTMVPSPPNGQYKTRHFLEFTIDEVDVDIMAGFTIVCDGMDHDRSFLPEQIAETVCLNGQTIPLQDPALWRQYYQWMGRPEKAALLRP